MNKKILTYAAIFVAVILMLVSSWYIFSSGIFTKNVLPAAIAIWQGTSTPAITTPPLLQYIEVVDGCGPYFNTGTCVNMRSGPGKEYPSVAQLRTGVVLKVSDTVTAQDGSIWYKIEFATKLLYPERVSGDLFVAADVVNLVLDDGDHRLATTSPPTIKRIVVDVSEQMLYAYEGNDFFMQESISTGLEFTPTPRGTFAVYKMTPSRYMQGPIPDVSDQYYDLPGVPWDLYFTQGGAVIHGAYWHDKFGEPWSHGCVNLPVQKAKELYLWAEIGMKVTVQD